QCLRRRAGRRDVRDAESASKLALELRRAGRCGCRPRRGQDSREQKQDGEAAAHATSIFRAPPAIVKTIGPSAAEDGPRVPCARIHPGSILEGAVLEPPSP